MPYVFDANEVEQRLKEEQIKRLIPDGVRMLTVVDCEQRDSDYGGYFMLGVKDKLANKESKIFISLSAVNHQNFKSSCLCFGIMNEYDLGSVDAKDYVGKTGACKMVHEEKPGYGLQAKVEQFMDASYVEETTNDIIDDDIPF